jgi:hypothetical protein
LMSSNANEARRLRPDQRKSSKDHDISTQKYTCWDEQALLVDTNVQRKRSKTRTSRIIRTRVGTCKLCTLIQMSL